MCLREENWVTPPGTVNCEIINPDKPSYMPNIQKKKRGFEPVGSVPYLQFQQHFQSWIRYRKN